jgi:alpha-maltose-1-phosphate synthase
VKVLMLTNEYPPNVYGGAGVHVDYLTRELAKLMDVDVRCFGHQRSEQDHLRVVGYGADEQMFAAADDRLRSPLQALMRCIRFNAAPIDATVVHCHTWYTVFGGIVAKLAFGIPLVITAHSLEPLRSWKRDQLGRGYDLSSWLEKTAIEMADAVIAVSAGMKQDIERLFDVRPERVRVIYNGIDTDEYHPVSTKNCFAKYGIDPNVPYVLFVGRITRQKGLLHLVHAIPYLEPDIQVVLCAGAPDTEAIRHEVAAAVRRVQENRANVVWIQEMVDKPIAIELYSNAAVFCCPSIYEPFGIINLEAMACSTPVVASKVGGIPEVVLEGETGLLVELGEQTGDSFEPQDPDRFARDLAAAVNQLMKNDVTRRYMGAAGRERAVQRFSWPTIAREVRRLYESLRDGAATAT